MTHRSCSSSWATTALSNLVGLAQQRAQDHPDRPAYFFLSGEELSPSSLTYSELDAQARLIAGFLQGLKARGERALLLYPPGLEFIAAFFGCLYAGVIAVPAYPPRLNRNALRIVSIAQDSQASLILTTDAVFSRRVALITHAPELGKVRWFATDKLQPGPGERWQGFSPDGAGLAYLQYTSGSTATPKGVMITHANVLENSAYLANAFRHSAENISLSWLPHFHDLGLVHGILQPLYSGFPGYLMAPMSFLQRPLDWLRAISRYRVTHSDGPNFAYQLCADKIADEDKRDLDLSHWRMALNGAEPVFPETIERFTRAFAACGFKRTAFYPAYGLAEATLVVSGGKKEPELAYCSVVSSALEQNKVVFVRDGTPGARTLVASGCFSPPMKVEIVEPGSRRKCAPDAIGEIWVAGPSLALGYWRRPEETQQVFRAKLSHDPEHTFLRTGDLGFIHDGNLFITGRLKEVIIIRGRNHYPQDIERTAHESCPEIRFGTGAAFSVPVGTEERLILVQELKRRQKADVQLLFSRMRAAILEEHEIQIHEILLVQAGSVPKTSSGKIQRGLCRQEFLAGSLQVISRWQGEDRSEGEMPEAATALVPDAKSIQAWLRSRIASRIGVDAEEIDVHRPLLHLGMDSLSAVALAHDIQTKLGIVWQAAAFLEDVTLADLAGRAARHLETNDVRTERDARGFGTKTECPLSFGQQGLWFLHQLSPESTAYNVALAITIRSSVDVPALRRSLQALVDRHGCLRSTFEVKEGKPVQRLHERFEVAFHCESAQHWNGEAFDRRLSVEAGAPFSLELGPLFRVHLFSRRAEEHVLLLTAHHIIVDLWSFAQMMTEFGALYEAERSGKAANLQAVSSDYSRFVEWQRDMIAGDHGRVLWSYWSRQLGGELPVLELPTDRPRPSLQTYRGASCPLRLSAELTARLVSLSRDCGATLYMTLLAAFQVLLHRYTGEEDIVVGSPMAGRTRAEFASTVGYFVNQVVLRTTVLPDSTFRAFLSHCVRKTVLEALEHQDYPFSLLTDKLQPVRDPRRSPLFQIMFAMQKTHLGAESLSLFALGESGARMDLGGLEMECFTLQQRISQFDLSLIVAEADGGLAATFEYNTDLFDSTTVRRMTRHFETLLQSIATDPRQEISRLGFFDEGEATPGPAHAAAGESSPAIDIPVQQLFERQAACTPDAPAIISEGQQLNYRQLNEQANQLARHLADRGVFPGARVAVCLERSAETIVSLLAVFKTNAVYVPIDPEYPRHRRDFMLDDARVDLLITKSHLADPASPGVKKLCLDLEDAAISRLSTLSQCEPGDGPSPAYIIYTSGSTGNPKGVLVSHRALSNHMEWLAGEFPLDENDRVLHKYSPSFDASLAEIFYPLITGAALVIARANGQYDPGYLIALMREHRVTAIDVVPTMLKVLIEDAGITRCKDLRQIFSGGEALSVQLKERVYACLGRVELVNMYGPTEATITASFHRCGRGQNETQMAIGIPVANTSIYLLDRSMNPVPPGVVGEIHIGGQGLAWGYLDQPQLTAENFAPDPFSGEAGARLYKTGDLGRYGPNGALAYVRRADAQTKIRGFRVELGEIEAELQKHSCVRNATALVRVRPQGNKYIAAYVEPFGDRRDISSAELRAYLRERLPEHTLPATITVMDQFPLLANGKPDFKALPMSDYELPELELAGPRDPIEQELVRIWQELLGRRDIGIHSNFFELGGDSILSIQVVARARDVGVELTPKQIFQFQTIAGLAQVAGTRPARLEWDAPVEGPVPLTPIQRWFFEQDLKAPEHYTQTLILEAREPVDPKLLGEAIHHLVMHHPALRLRFEHAPQGWWQRCEGLDVNGIFRYVPVHHLPAEQQSAEFEAISSDIRASLNLTTGPIIRSACFDFGASRPQRLLITVHHLAIDSVSWGTLLNDLERIYAQLERGEPLSFPRRTLSFRRWAELLADHAQSAEMQQESSWWIARLFVPIKRLPVDLHGENTAESSCSLIVSLPAEETRRLLQEVPRAYRTEINDALLAALARSLARWIETERVLIDLEGHGREEIVEGADVSGTVGWFTTVYPVLLELGANCRPEQVLESVKDQLRMIPRKGIGYGLLRYLSAIAAVSAKLKEIPSAQITFNYLGPWRPASSTGSLFEPAGDLIGPMKSSFGRRSHLLEIDGYIKDGSLQFQWTYSDQLHTPGTIQQVAADFINELRALIQHCAALKTSQYSSSDFPLTRLTGRQLAAILDVHRPIQDIYPLSPIQQGMLFHSLYEPRKGTYLTQLVCELSGDLNRDAFQAAWQRVVDNYSALRTGFEWEIATEEPVQVVRKKAELQWRQDDWSGVSSEQQERLLDAYLADDRKGELDLRKPPLMRFGLVKTGQSRHLFLWSCHHLLLDGWSLPVVLRDVFGMYESLCQNQSLHLESERPYRDYIAWLKQQNLDEAEDFWRRCLRGFSAPTALQSLRRADAGAVRSQDFREFEVRLTEPQTEQLRAFARRHHLTLSTITYGVWALLLSRVTEKNDVVFGVVVSGRQMRLAGAGDIVGVLINTLPMRARIELQEGLGRWLKQLQEQRSEATQFEHSPLSNIQSWSEVPAGVPLFDNIVVFENYPLRSWKSLASNCQITKIRSLEQSNYPITLWIVPEQQLCLRIGYDANFLYESRVMSLLNDCRRLLEAVGVQPQETLGELLDRATTLGRGEVDVPIATTPRKSVTSKPAKQTATPGPMAKSTQSGAVSLNGIETMSAAEVHLAQSERRKEEQDS